MGKSKSDVLAVIPARAGSKGIPNKNIRLLNGKPMIYYCINNAIKSRFITDIVVTTDSKLVEMICNQMGVRVHIRKKELCEDNITLDSVVFDASKDFEGEYIVTMQPTSPTLSVETLDNAIEYAVSKNLDTLISVINNPHLSWSDSNGVKIPNYKERCNRQYLPDEFFETGAFVISKKNVVTNTTRIGKKIDVFELSEQEAIDIDSFADLKVAEMYMSNDKIAFWVNGNNNMGLGHIFRVLELADEFYTKPDIYYDKNITDKSFFGNTTHNIIPTDGIKEFVDYVSKENYKIIINDSLDTTAEYMKLLKKNTCSKIVNFEDGGEGAKYADIVFNALYQDSELSNVKCGEKYYIVPRAFMFFKPIEIKEKVRKVFICFGGADPQNYTDRILAIISKNKYSSYEFNIVLGRAKKNVNELMKYKRDNIKIYYNVDNMPELMSQCDVAVTSRGRTGYETAVLGIPTISMSQNEREELHGFMSEENGYIYIGLNPSDYKIEANIDILLNLDIDDRKKMQTKLLEAKLVEGRKRIMRLINNL